MRSYRQFCPVAKAAEIFCERWNALILRDLAAGPRRFSELQRGVPLMSPSLLSARLKWLIREGVIDKNDLDLLNVVNSAEEVLDVIFRYYEESGFEASEAEQEIKLNL